MRILCNIDLFIFQKSNPRWRHEKLYVKSDKLVNNWKQWKLWISGSCVVVIWSGKREAEYQWHANPPRSERLTNMTITIYRYRRYIYIASTLWKPCPGHVSDLSRPQRCYCGSDNFRTSTDTRWAGWNARVMTLHKDRKIILIY